MAFNSISLKSNSPLSPTTKLLALKTGHRFKLIRILDAGNSWKELAFKIRNPDDDSQDLFSSDDINNMESSWRYNKTPAEVLLHRWSTTGIRQPTIRDLLNLLEETQLFRAADYVKTEILNIPKPLEDNEEDVEKLIESIKSFQSDKDSINNETNSSLENDAQNHVNISVENGKNYEAIIALENDQTNHETNITLENDRKNHLPQNSNEVKEFSYKNLAKLTNNFSDVSVKQGGFKLGEGSYSKVYRANISGTWVAIKKLIDPKDKQFFIELDILTRYRHQNLLPLLGYACDGPYCCIVYAFMENGSLQERLARKAESLSWQIRILIAHGTACGINHLHTYEKFPMVHRDIKSANILLDENLTPKIGDFGLVRIGESTDSSIMPVTKTVKGTSIYMPLEAFYGDVSVKLDTYSFGVVLLELLTGLPPCIASSDGDDLVTYMKNYNDIGRVLDKKAGKWDKRKADELYKISQSCLLDKESRPLMIQVLQELQELL